MNLNKIVAIMLMSTAVMMSYGANKPAFKIDRIEPEFWYAGMKETQLQLMVYGPQIAEAGFILGSPLRRLQSGTPPYPSLLLS